MYSKEESQRLKREFWIAFAEKHSRKWILYDTKIKDFSFKFYVDNKIAQVILSIENKNEEKRIAYFEKIEALKSILEQEFISDLIFERNYYLENGKIISQIWVEKNEVSVSNKNKWDEIFLFFYQKMDAFELFYKEYDDYIKDV